MPVDYIVCICISLMADVSPKVVKLMYHFHWWIALSSKHATAISWHVVGVYQGPYLLNCVAVYFAFMRRLFQWQSVFAQLSSQDCSIQCWWRHFPWGCWLTGLLVIVVTTYDMDVDRVTHIWVYGSICSQLLTQCVVIVCGCCSWVGRRRPRDVVSFKRSYYLKVWLIKLTFLWADNDSIMNRGGRWSWAKLST